jgi:GT2 family glycosyltransferase
MKISLIMPFYGKWEMTHQRLNELYKFIHPAVNLEIILINDKPQDDEPNGVGWWQKMGALKVRYFRNDENLGFGGSMNRGASKAEGDVLIFFSNDVVVSGDFVTQIIGALSVDSQRFIGNVVYDFDTGWNHLKMRDGKKILFPYAEGYLLACTKEVWEDLGGFDPIYYPYDFEDVDISTTALHKGYNLFALNSPYIRHLSGQTVSQVNPRREDVTRLNQQKFISKWSKILDA